MILVEEESADAYHDIESRLTVGAPAVTIELDETDLSDHRLIARWLKVAVAAALTLLAVAVAATLVTGENEAISADRDAVVDDGGGDGTSTAGGPTTSVSRSDLRAPGTGLPIDSMLTAPVAAGWVDPVIPPPSAWIDAGNGVAVPDLLLRIRFCESTNNYRAVNRSTAAYGAYQFPTSSWAGYGYAASYGATEASLATPAQQDEAALLSLQRDGARPWAASRPCWDDPEIDPAYQTARPQPGPTTAPTTATPVPPPTGDGAGPADPAASTSTPTATSTAPTSTGAPPTQPPTSTGASSTEPPTSTGASSTEPPTSTGAPSTQPPTSTGAPPTSQPPSTLASSTTATTTPSTSTIT